MELGAPDARRLAAARQLLTLLGTGLATGAGARALFGAKDVISNDKIETQPSAQLPPTIQIGSFGPRAKVANDLLTQGVDWASNRIADGLKSVGYTPDTSRALLNDYGMPLGVATAGAGVYGGYKLVDWLMRKAKEREATGTMQDAEQQYRQALAEQYRTAMQAKRAGDDLGITALADQVMEKKGFFPLIEAIVGKNTMNNIGTVWPGAGNYDNYQAYKGLVHTAEGLAALGTGKVTYDWVRKKNKQELLNKALRKRQQQRSLLSPSPIVAELSPEADAA